MPGQRDGGHHPVLCQPLLLQDRSPDLAGAATQGLHPPDGPRPGGGRPEGRAGQTGQDIRDLLLAGHPPARREPLDVDHDVQHGVLPGGGRGGRD